MIFHQLYRKFRNRKAPKSRYLDLRPTFSGGPDWIVVLPKKVNWRLISAIAASTAFIVGGLFLYNSLATRGEVNDFNPSLCLGTWKNPSNAQGIPETTRGQSFSEDNSAVFPGSGNVYCGGFVPADYEAQGKITGVTASFKWGFPPLATSTTITVPGEEQSTGTTTFAPRLLFAQAPAAAESDATVPAPPAAAAEELASLPAEGDVQSQPALPARAQEDGVQAAPPDQPAADAADVPHVLSEEKNASGSADSIAPPDIPVPEVVLQPQVLDDDFLRVSISYDGENWFEAGRVNLDVLLNYTISMPVRDWQELRKLQVRVEGIPSAMREIPPVHLDGIILEAQYEVPPVFGNEEELIAEVDLENIPIESLPIKLARDTQAKAFSADDSPFISIPLDAIIAAQAASSTTAGTATNTPPTLQPVPALDVPSVSPPDTPPVGDNKAIDSAPALETTSETFEDVLPKDATGPTPDAELPSEPAATSTPTTMRLRHIPPGTNYARSYFRPISESVAPGLFSLIGRWLMLKPAQAQETAVPVTLAENKPYYAELIDPAGKKAEAQPYVVKMNGVVRVSVPSPATSMKPGRYVMRVWMLQNGKVYYSQEQFLWGVIAANTDYATYPKNHPGRLMLGILDDNGHTICDAQVTVTVTSPSSRKYVYSTGAGDIAQSGSCGPDNVTDIPDYSLSVPTTEEGTYSMDILAQTDWGPRELIDSYQVEASPVFEVQRVGPTRIYPSASYVMTLRVRANAPYAGYLTEIIPAGFLVKPSVGGDLSQGDGVQYLRWPVKFAAGDEVQFAYSFDAPDISPVIHKLGPASIGGWQETRQWMIAGDAVNADGRLFMGKTNSAGNIYLQTRSDSDVWATFVTSTIIPTASNISFLRAAFAPNRDEAFIGTMHINGTAAITKCVDGCDAAADFTGDTGDNFTKTSVTTAQTCNATVGACSRAFDVNYEQLSGQALAVFASSSNGVVQYCTFATSTWSGSNCANPSTFTLTGSGARVLWLRLYPEGGEQRTKNRSNRILLVAMDNANDIFAAVWDGSFWGNQATMTTTAPASTTEPFTAAWEVDGSNRAIVIFGSGTATTSQAYYRTFTTSTWSNSSTIGTFGASSQLNWAVAQADPKSDKICLATHSSGGEVSGWMWRNSGSDGFTRFLTDTSGAEGAAAVAAGCAWEKQNSGGTTSTALWFLTDNSTSDISKYWTWLNGVATTTDMPGAMNDDAMQFGEIGVRGSPNGDVIMAVGESITCDLEENYWNGSTMALADYLIDPAGTVASSDNIPQDTCANNSAESAGYYFLFRPYIGWSRNWQWYKNTTTTNPTGGVGLNTMATTTRSGVMRLRMQIQELLNVAETDSRKKLQFVASSTCPNPDTCPLSSWTDVGEFTDSSAVWRYATTTDTGCSSCTDGASLPSALLASSTQTSTFVVSGTAAPATNMDFNASSTTEVDYPLKAQYATVGETYFFRVYDVTDNTVDFRRQDKDNKSCSGVACTYPSITIQNAAPSVSSIVVNGGSDITLIPNATKTVTVAYQVTDYDGCNDVFTSGTISGLLMRSGASSTCSESALNSRNCYEEVSIASDCSGANFTANATNTYLMWYYADATDASSSFPSENWIGSLVVRDGAASTTNATSSGGVEVMSIAALQPASSSFAYPAVLPGGDTGSSTRFLEAYNVGNSSWTLQISGTALKNDSFIIPTSSQHFASGTFTYGGGEQQLSASTVMLSGIVVMPGVLRDNWSSSTMTTAFGDSPAFAYNDKLYLLGGGTNAGLPTSSVHYATINSTGSVSGWSLGTALPTSTYSGVGFAHNGYVYYLGGATVGPTYTSTVRFAALNPDGSFASNWTNTTPLPNASAFASTTGFLYKGRAYILGGATTSVIYANINSTGSLGVWNNTTVLPSVISSASSFAYNDRAYILGGNLTSTVRYAQINGDGSIGAWYNTTPLPVPLQSLPAFAYNGRVYVVGGDVGGTVSTSTVYYADIVSDGAFSSWTKMNAFPVPVGITKAFPYNGRAYLPGGYDAGYSNLVYYTNLGGGGAYWGYSAPVGLPPGNYTGIITLTPAFSQ